MNGTGMVSDMSTLRRNLAPMRILKRRTTTPLGTGDEPDLSYRNMVGKILKTDWLDHNERIDHEEKERIALENIISGILEPMLSGTIMDYAETLDDDELETLAKSQVRFILLF
jgi:hypothetical protein